ncbi:MAG: carboxylating nicotinate-nucleotide diphosphorylase [Candidatus Krumholzibacteriota bacterium]|nr:carboxylating nicotinate-nucleotide diphosphorylase [Candidatus Krumholzibacteriota bacterium]
MSDPWLDWPVELRRAAWPLVALALDEDLGAGDVTARWFGGGPGRLAARLTAREPGVLAGLPLFLVVFAAAAAHVAGEALDPDRPLAAAGLAAKARRTDGEVFAAGETLAELELPAAALHAGERTALNFLQRLSGVATATARAVAASCGPAVLDTRKTTPGYRLLEKYAVRMGGGRNHRLGLWDAAMVKDNHKEALGGIAAVMARLTDLPAGLPVIIEVDDPAELAAVLAHPAAPRVTRILLDNFSPGQVADAVALRAARGGGPDYEISGGLTGEDLADPAYAGVEAASLGAVTHSARALDLALEVISS